MTRYPPCASRSPSSRRAGFCVQRVVVACSDGRGHGRRQRSPTSISNSVQADGAVDPQDTEPAGSARRTDQRKVKIKEAKKFSVDPSAAEIDAPTQHELTDAPDGDQLTQSLEQGFTATLKHRLRAEMVWNALVRVASRKACRLEKRSSVRAPGKGDEKEADSFEPDRPIVLIVAKGSGQSALEARHKEAQALRDRIQTCDEANATLNSMQNAAIRATVTRHRPIFLQPCVNCSTRHDRSSDPA